MGGAARLGAATRRRPSSRRRSRSWRACRRVARELVQNLIMEATLSGRRLSVSAARQMPPQLAWRCEAMAEQIAGASDAFLEAP